MPTLTKHWPYRSCWQACYQRVHSFAQNMMTGTSNLHSEGFQTPLGLSKVLTLNGLGFYPNLKNQGNVTPVPFRRLATTARNGHAHPVGATIELK